MRAESLFDRRRLVDKSQIAKRYEDESGATGKTTAELHARGMVTKSICLAGPF